MSLKKGIQRLGTLTLLPLTLRERWVRVGGGMVTLAGIAHVLLAPS